ncbi:uncharacterized protein LOC116846457 [Odontomachus brunneus]|uniref:uncharacterized protein LOC116846457 n=1 Tax=Odontomachus brunneus TaxID=486640 RepID=UPI0013F227CB|nr:uncharacterized protein LOC116846457 [Odontomachus brunneus]
MAVIQYYVVYLIILIHCSNVLLEDEYCIEQFAERLCQPQYEIYKETSLELVSVLFNRGDRYLEEAERTSYRYLLNESDKRVMPDPDFYGPLINIGKRRAYELGKFLRKRYDRFLGDTYNPANVYARSTQSAINKMSLQLVLAGLYPPVNQQKWNSDLDWQPFDMTYAHWLNDSLVQPYICFRFYPVSVRQQYEKEKQFLQNKISIFNETMVTLSEYTKKNITSIDDLINLYRLFNVYLSLGKSLPHWAEKMMQPQGELYRASILAHMIGSYPIHLNGGTILYKVLKDMKAKMNQKLTDKKINLFSGNGLNVAAVLYALKLFNDTMPQYTSSVIIELHKKDGNYFVQILYYLGIPPVLVKKTLHKCSTLCPFDMYVQLTKSATMTDDDPNCPIDDSARKMANAQSFVGYFIMLIFYLYIFTIQETAAFSEKTRANYEVNVENTNLRLVSMILRHGDRTLDDEIKKWFPNDPNKNYNDYPNNNGLLTEAGKERAFQFGQMLKKTYGRFLGDIYYPPNVYARSSAIPRTKMTLQLILAALYPSVKSKKLNAKLGWQPVDMIYTRVSEDGLIFPYHCKEYEQAYVNILKSNEVKIKNNFGNLMEDLSEHVGRNITSLFDLYVLYNIFLIQLSMNLTLPDWSRDIFPRGKLQDASLFQLKLYNYNDELIKLNGGVLLYKIIQDMIGIMNGTLANRKINIICGHDVNVVAMLYVLGIYDNSFPAFTSSVIMELREKDGKYFVRVLRYLGIPSSLIEVKIPECDPLCPFEKFVRLRLSMTAVREDPNCPLSIPLF